MRSISTTCCCTWPRCCGRIPRSARTSTSATAIILVDEYQDTNLAQYAIARALSIDYPNLAVTGDPDQSIYGWRGANLHNILEFEKDFPQVRVVRLEQNYRSTKRILRVAADLIRHNVKRKQKDLFTENGEGRPVRLVTYRNEREEAEEIAAEIAAEIRAGRRRPRDFAIFYRINALSRAFEAGMHDQGIPYQLVRGLEFFKRKEIKDILAYLQLLNNPRDEGAFLRVINTPTRGIGKTAIERLADHARQHGLTLLEAAPRRGRHGLRSTTAPRRRSWSSRRFSIGLAQVDQAPIEEILGSVLSDSQYEQRLQDSGDAEDQERLANIQELLTVARQFDEHYDGPDRLERFLEQTSLVNDTDDWQSQNDRVTLMTLHASKGLEFPVVYLVAVEEGLLPHERSAAPGPTRGRAPLDVRGHYPGAGGVADQPRRIPRFPRPPRHDGPQSVPDGIAARRHGDPRAEIRLLLRGDAISRKPIAEQPVPRAGISRVAGASGPRCA